MPLVNNILSAEMLTTFLLELEYSWDIHSYQYIQHNTGSSSCWTKASKRKGIYVRKEEKKHSSSTDDIVVYKENPRSIKKKKNLLKANKWVQQGCRTTHWNKKIQFQFYRLITVTQKPN